MSLPEYVSPLIAFVAGLLTFFSPCVIPLLPAYICYITGLSFEEITELRNRKTTRRITSVHSLLFILGFSLIFILLGASATYLGKLLGDHRVLLKNIGGVVVILLGMHIAGILPVPFGVPIKFLLKERWIRLSRKPWGYLGSILVGITFALGWIPCIGPVLSAILVYAASTQRVSQGIALLAVYSLGLAVPLFISSIAMTTFLSFFQKIKKFLRVVSVVAGALLILAGIMIISGQFMLVQASTQKGTGEDSLGGREVREGPLRERAADFNLLSLSGERISLSELRGKVVILHFWATWCSVCRDSIPELRQLYRKYKNEGIELLAIAIDARGRRVVEPFVKKVGIDYPVLLGDREARKAYAIFGLPTTFVIDPQGNIYKKYVGYRSGEVFEEDIVSLINENRERDGDEASSR